MSIATPRRTPALLALILAAPLLGGCGQKMAVKVNGEVVDAVDVYVGGRSGPHPKAAVRILEDVPCDKLSAVLEGLVPYHTREKLHRPGRRTTAKPGAATPGDRSAI